MKSICTGIALLVLILVYGLIGSIDLADRETEAQHTQEIKERARADAKALARQLREQHMFEEANSLMYPIAQVKQK